MPRPEEIDAYKRRSAACFLIFLKTSSPNFAGGTTPTGAAQLWMRFNILMRGAGALAAVTRLSKSGSTLHLKTFAMPMACRCATFSSIEGRSLFDEFSAADDSAS